MIKLPDSKMILRPITEVNDFKQFSDLLDTTFGVKGPDKFLDDFPVWDIQYSQKNIHRLGIFLDNNLIATAAVRLVEVDLGEKNNAMHAGIIGAVATQPAWRGKGLASLIVEQALNWAQGAGAVVVFLWGSEHSLYQRLGFELCGQQVRVPLKEVYYSGEGHSKPMPVARGWNDFLFDLIRKRSGGLILKNQDIQWFRAHKNVQWFYQMPIDQPTAYAGFGRGIDLKGIVHEWGGEHSCLSNIFRQIEKMEPGATLLGSPARLEELVKQGWKMPSAHFEHLCLAKILDLQGLKKLLFTKIDFQASSNTHLASTLFGGIHSVNRLSPQAASQGGFAVPLWFWGLDAS